MTGEVLGARNPTTIRTLRQIHEGCKTRHRQGGLNRSARTGELLCARCGHEWPCADYVDAVAALDQLNNAIVMHDIDGNELPARLVPDPGVGAEHAREDA